MDDKNKEILERVLQRLYPYGTYKVAEANDLRKILREELEKNEVAKED